MVAIAPNDLIVTRCRRETSKTPALQLISSPRQSPIIDLMSSGQVRIASDAYSHPRAAQLASTEDLGGINHM